MCFYCWEGSIGNHNYIYGWFQFHIILRPSASSQLQPPVKLMNFASPTCQVQKLYHYRVPYQDPQYAP